MITRRLLLGAAAGALALARDGAQLRARPAAAGQSTPGAGLRGLGIRKRRDAQLYVPKSVAEAGKPAPFLVYLHGAGGNEQQGIKRLSDVADAKGFVLLVPASEGTTWDAVRDGYGADVRALDAALARAFEICNVDAARVGVSGFSDGASYALGLGLANGGLFPSVMAWSPGFVPSGFEPAGKPRIFISHGTSDPILPIETCSRVLVPKLKGAGYAVTYREFDGVHTLPPAVREEAFRWFLD